MARLLIVEDEGTLRRSLDRYLSGQGFEVVTAASLKDAERALEEMRFDLALLDVGLPDGNGLSLLERTGIDRSLVITANADPLLLERYGAKHHLPKPLDLSQLASALSELGAT